MNRLWTNTKRLHKRFDGVCINLMQVQTAKCRAQMTVDDAHVIFTGPLFGDSVTHPPLDQILKTKHDRVGLSKPHLDLLALQLESPECEQRLSACQELRSGVHLCRREHECATYRDVVGRAIPEPFRSHTRLGTCKDRGDLLHFRLKVVRNGPRKTSNGRLRIDRKRPFHAGSGDRTRTCDLRVMSPTS